MAEWIDVGPHIVSGVINNSEKGKTMAELVIDGLDAPVVLELHGNAAPDLAGCILKFRCPRSWPVDDYVLEALPKDRLVGNVGVITGAIKRDTYTEAGTTPKANVLCFEWYDFSTLTRYVFERADCEMEVDLSRWTLSADEIERQKKEWKATRETFEGMWQEFEEDLLDQDIFDKQQEKLDAIMPKLEATETDEEKRLLMEAALGPDVDENEVEGWFDVLFGPDDSDWDLPHVSVSDQKPKPRQGLIELDDEIKAAARKLAEVARLLGERWDKEAEQEEREREKAPSGVVELANGVIHTTNLIATSGLLDALPDGKHRIEPYSMLEVLAQELSDCEALIQTLELEARKRHQSMYSELVWGIREALGKLIGILDMKKPDQPPPKETESDNELPF